MTLRKTYQEIMENIEVTPDMRERILKNIQQPEVRKASSKYRGKTFQRWYPAAACVALLLCAALVLPRLLSPDTGTSPDGASSDTDFPGEEQTTIVNGMVSYDSAAALSAALGFPVEDLAELPFTPDTVSYLDCWGEYAEITYENADASVTFRKIPGQEDISGDYNVYDTVTTQTIAGEEVTLKGDADGYFLAIWSDDTYSYALSFTPQVAEETVAAIIQAMSAK